MDRTDLHAAKMLIGCESIKSIPSVIQAVIERHMYPISIRVTTQLSTPPKEKQDPAADLKATRVAMDIERTMCPVVERSDRRKNLDKGKGPAVSSVSDMEGGFSETTGTCRPELSNTAGRDRRDGVVSKRRPFGT